MVKLRASGARPPQMAQALGKAAFEASVDSHRVTPYSLGASEAFNMIYNGEQGPGEERARGTCVRSGSPCRCGCFGAAQLACACCRRCHYTLQGFGATALPIS